MGIARAVVSEPRLLVADEPSGNLDPTLSAEIMALFASLPEHGTSVLIASHDLGLVKRMKKRVLVLDHGTLVDYISPAALADEYQARHLTPRHLVRPPRLHLLHQSRPRSSQPPSPRPPRPLSVGRP